MKQTRKNVDIFNAITTVEELVSIPVTEQETVLVKRPASTSDWSFNHTVREVYTHETIKQVWKVVEVRPATEEEMNETLFDMLPL